MVLCVHAADRQHAHQHVYVLDLCRVAREKRLHRIRLVRLDDKVDPVAGDIDARQRTAFDDLVDLYDDDAAFEGSGLHDRGRIFGAEAGVEIAVLIRLHGGDKADLRREINIEPSVELKIRVDRADLQLSLRKHLGQLLALHTGKGEIQLSCDAAFEQLQMVVPGNGRDDHVQIADRLRVHLRQCMGQKGRLLLIAAFQHDIVAAVDDRL